MSRIIISRTKNGILIKYNNKRVLIDPDGVNRIPYEPNFILISHAHADHVRGLRHVYKKGTKVVLAKETYWLLKSLGYKFYDEDLIFVKPGDSLSLDGISITVYNAGHILGSCMFALDLSRVRIGYTGDFNFEDTVVTRKADVIDADLLLIDATYGHPLFSFPPRNILYKLIREKLREIFDSGLIPSLHGYALGKGQELTRIAYDFVGGIVSVTGTIAKFNRIFEEFNKVSLGNYVIGARGDVFVKDFREIRRTNGERFKKIVFSGWVIKFNKRGFPLSSHSGFTKIIDYIYKADPDFVIPLYSNAAFLARLINREFGIKADFFDDEVKSKDIIYNVSLRGLNSSH